MLCGFLPQPDTIDAPPGNVVAWPEWEEAANLVGLDPRHMHTGQKALTNQVASKVESRVLDVGCGVGGLLSLLPRRVDAVGLDISSYCVDRARLQLESRDNARVINADILDTDEEEIGRFSSIVGLDVFHMLNRNQIIKKCSDLLKKQGKLIFTDCLSDNEYPELFKPFKANPPLTEEKYKCVINNHSLDIESTDDYTKECMYETEKVLSKFKQNTTKEWIISKWGEEYYNYTVRISREWNKLLRSKEIKYVLFTASKYN